MARSPPGLEHGSPFGDLIATLALYLPYTQGISLEWLRGLFKEVFGLQISDGTPVNPFRHAANTWRSRPRRCRSGCAPAAWCAETSAHVVGHMWWEWVFVREGAVLHELSASRATSVPERVMAGARQFIPIRK